MTSGPSRTSRREWLLWSTLSAVVSGAVASVGGPRRTAPRAAGAARLDAPSLLSSVSQGARQEPADAATLLSPYSEGSSIGPWKVEQLIPLQDGTAGVILSGDDGVPFQLDICARDTSIDAPRPPASSAAFDVYLANGGEGRTPSFEHHGLAAMAVAEVIRQNEAHLGHSGFVTLRERLSVAYDSMRRSA